MLHELQNATPAISNAGRYARIVQDTALLRRLIGVAGEIAEIAYSEPDDVTKALDEAETKVFEVAEDRVVDSTRPLDELLPRRWTSSQETYERGDTITGVATGYNDLDELLSGLQPTHPEHRRCPPGDGQDRVRAGHGHAHREDNGASRCSFFSLEMGHAELTQRILSSEAGSTRTKLRTGRLGESDWTKIGRAIGRLEVPLFLDDNPQRHGDGDPRQGPAA